MFKQPNKVMAKYELKRQQEKDFKALEDIKQHKGPTMVDNLQPWQSKKKNSFPRVNNIQEENIKMIKKLEEIQYKDGQYMKGLRQNQQLNDSEYISYHKNLKNKILEDITVQNYQMTKRIYQTKSTVDFKKFDQQRHQTEKYLSLISESFSSNNINNNNNNNKSRYNSNNNNNDQNRSAGAPESSVSNLNNLTNIQEEPELDKGGVKFDKFDKDNKNYKLRKSNRVIVYRKPAQVQDKDYFIEILFEDGYMSIYAENSQEAKFQFHLNEITAREILIRDCNDEVEKLLKLIRIDEEGQRMYLLRKKRRPLSPIPKLPRGKQRIDVTSRYREPPKKHLEDDIPKLNQNKIIIKKNNPDLKSRNYSQRSGPTQRTHNEPKKSGTYPNQAKPQSDQVSKSTSRNKDHNAKSGDNYEEDFQNEDENYNNNSLSFENNTKNNSKDAALEEIMVESIQRDTEQYHNPHTHKNTAQNQQPNQHEQPDQAQKPDDQEEEIYEQNFDEQEQEKPHKTNPPPQNEPNLKNDDEYKNNDDDFIPEEEF